MPSPAALATSRVERAVMAGTGITASKLPMSSSQARGAMR